MKPFERFIEEALKEFEQHLRTIGMTGAREHRMRGARQFARFLVGRPTVKHEVVKGRAIG
jgi:hypothetical protein